MRRLTLGLLLILSLHSAASTPMVYRYWDWGVTPKRDDAQVAALELALTKTQAQYGPFQIIRHTEFFSTSRVRREVNRGEIVNIQVGPWRSLETDPAKLSERSLRVEVPLFYNILGYRQLIIRKADEDIFKRIKSSDDLKKLTAGQARGWQDVDIYRHNGYQVSDEASVTTLFAMLQAKRFDYLPMSISEASSALDANPEYRQHFMVVPDIIIYYPFPTIFYVSAKQPQLATRLEAGLKLAERDGSLEKLFALHYRDEATFLKNKHLRAFVLDNPFIPEHLKQRQPRLLAH